MKTNPYAPPTARVADPEPTAVKDMVEEHAAPDPDSAPMSVEHVKLSGLMTFFFSIFYLQWAINRYVVGRG